jgi:hypothetical protein
MAISERSADLNSGGSSIVVTWGGNRRLIQNDPHDFDRLQMLIALLDI